MRREIPDYRVVAQLAERTDPSFTYERFEASAGLETLPDEPVEWDTIVRHLGQTEEYERVLTAPNLWLQMCGILPLDRFVLDPRLVESRILYVDRTLREAKESLLPTVHMYLQSIDSAASIPDDEDSLVLDETRLRRSLCYTMARTVMGLPYYVQKIIDAHGLDPLTRSLINVALMARATGRRISWTSLLTSARNANSWAVREPVAFYPLSGLMDWENDFAVGIASRSLKGLLNQELVKLCAYVNRIKGVVNLTTGLVEEALNKSRSMAHRNLREMETFISETFMLNLQTLGLRYRIVFSEAARPIIWNTGLAEIIELADSDYLIAQLYLETMDCHPPDLPDSTFTVTGQEEVGSIHMDMFKPQASEGNEGGVWDFSPWESEGAISSPLWIRKKTPKKPAGRMPSQTDLTLLGLLVGHNGCSRSRYELMNRSGMPNSSIYQSLRNIEEYQYVTQFLHPAPEYCYLGDRVMLAVRCNSAGNLEDLNSWLLNVVPFARIARDNTNSCLFARLNVPLYRGPLSAAFISERLSDEFHRDDFAIGTVRSEKSYWFSVLKSLYGGDRTPSSPWK